MTKYVVNPTALGSAGRTVRCVRCGHQWHQKPSAGADLSAPEQVAGDPSASNAALSGQAAAERLGAASATAERPTAERPTVERPTAEGPAAAAARAVPPLPPLAESLARPTANLLVVAKIPLAARIRLLATPARLGWAGFAIALAAVPLGLWLGQKPLVASWPPAAKLYVAMGLGEEEELPGQGLSVPDLKPRIELDNGATILVLEGTVVNGSGRAVSVPLLKANLRDDHSNVLRSWTFRLDVDRLAPGASASFRTRHEQPPEGASRVEVVFTAAEKAAVPAVR